MIWKSWPYWVKGGIISGVVIFSLLYILDSYMVHAPDLPRWRQQHPYLASVHRTVATAPALLAVILTPAVCKPIELKEGGTTDCFGVFSLIFNILECVESLVIGILLGYFYDKFKNRNKPPVNGNSL